MSELPRLRLRLDDTLLLADEVAVLDAGRVLQRGPPAEVARHPAGPRVAWLLGTQDRIAVTAGEDGPAPRQGLAS